MIMIMITETTITYYLNVYRAFIKIRKSTMQQLFCLMFYRRFSDSRLAFVPVILWSDTEQ